MLKLFLVLVSVQHFSSHRQSSTGSVVVTTTCATSPLSQFTSKTKVFLVPPSLAPGELRKIRTSASVVLLFECGLQRTREDWNWTPQTMIVRVLTVPWYRASIDEVFADCALPTPPGPPPLWGPGSIPNSWADVCGFSQASWLPALLES